jgi:hypothetical protein
VKRRWQNYLLADIVALAGAAAAVAVVLHKPAWPTDPPTDGGVTALLRCTERAKSTLAQIRRRKQPIEVGVVEGGVSPRHTRWLVSLRIGRTPDRLDCEIRDEHQCLLHRLTVPIGSRPAETEIRLTLCSAQDFVRNRDLVRLESIGPGIELALILASTPQKRAGQTPARSIQTLF